MAGARESRAEVTARPIRSESQFRSGVRGLTGRSVWSRHSATPESAGLSSKHRGVLALDPLASALER